MDLGLEPTGATGQWRMPVTLDVAGGAGQLFGGCAIGAAAWALEQLSDKPAVWATGQFLSMALPPEVVTMDARLVSEGRNFAQGRVVVHVEGREIVTVQGACGAKDFASSGRFVTMPDVAPPEECPERSFFGPSPGRLHHHLEQRFVLDEHRAPNGRVAVWMRFPDGGVGSTIGLAVAADFLPLAVRAALERETFGASLDNTMRYLRRTEEPWILADLQVEEVAEGVAHGGVRLWSRRGELLAMGSQTCNVRDM